MVIIKRLVAGVSSSIFQRIRVINLNKPNDKRFLSRMPDTLDTKEVLMCPPKHFCVEYQINPWMGGTVDIQKAQQQWDNLKSAIEHSGVKVRTIEPQKGLPDMVFVCNSGIYYEDKVYLAKFRHPERQGEQVHYKKWYLEHGYAVVEDEHFFEGGGDATFSSKDLLWAGYGFRTEKKVYEKVQQLGPFQTVLCELNNDRFYHLDTCFAPMSKNLALWYPNAFSKDTQQRMRDNIELLEVSEEDANRFVCNSIAFGETVIAPPGCDETKNELEKRGFKVIEVDLSEFMKSGGACQCLVMKLK